MNHQQSNLFSNRIEIRLGQPKLRLKALVLYNQFPP